MKICLQKQHILFQISLILYSLKVAIEIVHFLYTDSTSDLKVDIFEKTLDFLYILWKLV